MKAIQCLETVLFTSSDYINETIASNLCSLYDIALADKSLEKKRALFSYLTKHAPDNFDFSVLKIPGIQ
jgi:hypothetical protein